MCKNSYEKISNRTNKRMLFCKLLGTDGSLSQICISQRFCKEKDRYIVVDGFHRYRVAKEYFKLKDDYQLLINILEEAH